MLPGENVGKKENEAPENRGLIIAPSDEVRAQAIGYYTPEAIAFFQGVIPHEPHFTACLERFLWLGKKINQVLDADGKINPMKLKTMKITPKEWKQYNIFGDFFTRFMRNAGAQAAHGRDLLEPALKAFENYSLSQTNNLQNGMFGMGGGAPYVFSPTSQMAANGSKPNDNPLPLPPQLPSQQQQQQQQRKQERPREPK